MNEGEREENSLCFLLRKVFPGPHNYLSDQLLITNNWRIKFVAF